MLLWIPLSGSKLGHWINYLHFSKNFREARTSFVKRRRRMDRRTPLLLPQPASGQQISLGS